MNLNIPDRHPEYDTSRSKSTSPNRTTRIAEYTGSNLFIEKLRKKDKEITDLHRELDDYREKLREFEYLIVKASEEVKRKQIEINSLNQVIQSYRADDVHSQMIDLQRDLADSRTQVKNYETVLTQIRGELVKEREAAKDYSEKNKELKSQLDKISAEAKAASENYQKNYAQLAQRYAKAEKDVEDSTKNYVDLTHQNELKDQAINQAHQVVKKLKEELDASKAETIIAKDQSVDLEKKVKEYKSKCKTLKTNNLKHSERIKELECFEKEVIQAREEVQNYIKARIEDRNKFSSERDRLSNENQEYSSQLSKLRAEFESLSQAKVASDFQLSVEATRNNTLTSTLAEKEAIIKQLTEELAQVEDKYRKEYEGFKSQALKTIQTANELQPLSSRNVSPFKQTQPLTQTHHISDFSLANTNSNEIPEKTTRIQQKVVRKAAVLKTAPIRTGPSKLEAIEILMGGELDPQPKPESNPSHELLQASFQITQSNEVPEPQSQPISQIVPVSAPAKDPLTVEFLKEQLSKSMDREHFYALVLENITKEAEANTRYYLEKVQNSPIVPVEYERMRMHAEELETRYATTVEKYQRASALVFDLLTNNKLLADKVSELTYNLKYYSMCFNDFSRTLIYENIRRDEFCNGLLGETKNLFTAIELQENNFQGEIKHSGEILIKMTAEVERVKNELHQVEDLCDSYKMRELNIKEPSSTSPMKSPKKKTAPQKVNSIFNQLKSVIAELEHERKYILERYTSLEKEYNVLKSQNNDKETEIKETFKQLELAIKEKEDLLEKKNQDLADVQELYRKELDKTTQQLVKRDTEFSQSVKEFNSNLREKQENISSLMLDKQNMAQVIESISNELADSKRKIEALNKQLQAAKEAAKEIAKEAAREARDTAAREFAALEAAREAAAKEAAAKEALLKETQIKEAQAKETQQKEEPITKEPENKESKDNKNDQEDLPRFAASSERSNNLSSTLRRNHWTERMEKKDQPSEEKLADQDEKSPNRKPIGERTITFNSNANSNYKSTTQRVEELTKEISSLHQQIIQKNQDNHAKDKLINDLNHQIATLTQDVIELENRLQNFTLLNQKSDDRPSYSRPEESSSIHSRLSIRSRRTTESAVGVNGEVERLKAENSELLQKLHHLNELVSTNRLLEMELGGSTIRSTTSARDVSPMEGTNRSPFRNTQRFTDKTSPISRHSAISTQQDKGDILYDPIANTNDEQRELYQKLEDHIPEKEILAHVESYKAKTKKILHKRVKELEMILRYVDLKLRGFNFTKSCFANSSTSKAFLTYDEVKSNAKIGSFVEHLIEKNITLKSFVDSMVQTAEKLHVRQHNMMILAARLIKTMMISSDSEVTTEVYNSAVGPELEIMFGLKFPILASKFDQIETLETADSRGDFFGVFERLEPKFELLCDLLTEMVTLTRKDNYDSRSGTGSLAATKIRDYLNTKMEKVKDIESLYSKLKTIIERNNATTLTSLQDNLKNYVQTYDNIFQALANECKALINFSGSIPREKSMTTIPTLPQYTSVNKENSALRTDYNSREIPRIRYTPGKLTGESPIPERRTSMNTLTTPEGAPNRNIAFNLDNLDRSKSSREADELSRSGRTSSRRFFE